MRNLLIRETSVKYAMIGVQCSNLVKVHTLLSKKEERIVAGFIVYRNMKRRSTRTAKLEEFLRVHFGLYPSKSWYTRFCKRQRLSYRTTAVAKWSEKSKNKWKEAVKFLKKTRREI